MSADPTHTHAAPATGPLSTATPVAGDPANTAGPAEAPPTAPATGGPPGYELLDEVGRGGMGVVHRARDVRIGRDVAVKLLQDRYPATGPAARRFVAEARITGRLQHPGIPPVHEVGGLADGRPFLAMKLIKGQTLADLLAGGADRGRLVAVFEKVCEAVGYAHAHNVIHRDLKPANVMVGGHGEVQVMDWGLAKVLTVSSEAEPSEDGDPEATTPATEIADDRKDSDRTRDGQALGTPAFMPPEQAVGAVAAMDRRSDVFGLGAVLCTILTGKPPYLGSDAGSTRQLAAQAKLSDAFARLDGCGAEPDLVSLCKRCLSPDRADRPADAGAVADAVAALRAAADERARRAEVDRGRAEVRRRLQLRLGGTVAAVLIAGAAGVGAQWRRAERALVKVTEQERETVLALVAKTAESERAERNFAQADANLKLAERNLAERDAARDETVKALRKLTDGFVEDQLGRRPALTKADRTFLREVQGLWQAVADTRGDTADALALRAEGAFRVGDMQHKLGETVEAGVAFRIAAAAYERLAAVQPAIPGHRFALTRTHHSLGSLLENVGRLAEAEAAYRAALALQAGLTPEFPANPTYRYGFSLVNTSLGYLLTRTGRAAEAERAYRTALQMLKELVAASPTNRAFRDGLATAYANLGILLQLDADRAAEAEVAYQNAIELLEKLSSDFPAVPTHRHGLATSRTNLGSLLIRSGRATEGERSYRAALHLQGRLAAEFPSHPVYRERLAYTNTKLGDLMSSDGRATQAERAYRVALDLLKQLAANHPTLPNHRSQLAVTHLNLGVLLAKAGRATEAEAAYRAALSLQEKLTADFPDSSEYRTNLGNTSHNLGRLFLNTGRPADGLPWFARAIDALAPIHAALPNRTGLGRLHCDSYAGRALALDLLHRPAEAAADWDRAVELSSPADQPDIRAARADSLALIGQVSRAVAEVAELAELRREWVAERWYNFACVYAVAGGKLPGKRDEYAARAVALLRRAVAAGYADAAHMAKDADLDPLRRRLDFRWLLAKLEARAKRKPELAPPPRPVR